MIPLNICVSNVVRPINLTKKPYVPHGIVESIIFRHEHYNIEISRVLILVQLTDFATNCVQRGEEKCSYFLYEPFKNIFY